MKISRLYILTVMLLPLPATEVPAAVCDGFKTSVHAPRDGDRLHPGVSVSPAAVSAVDTAGRSVRFSSASFFPDASSDCSVHVFGDTVCHVQFGTAHRFAVRSDTLLYLGFENRGNGMSLTVPVTAAVFPLRDGFSSADGWTGRVRSHGSDMLRRVKGISASRVDLGWTLTDGTDTVRNAARLTWTLDMAYMDTDSVSADLPDSIAVRGVSDLEVDMSAVRSERLLTRREMWFAGNARYPVLERTAVSRVRNGENPECDTVPLSTLAMHYPAAYQYADTGDEEIRGIVEDENAGEMSGSDEGASSLSIGDATADGDRITVTLSSSIGSADAVITLYSDSGIRLTEPVTVSIGTLPQTCELDIPAGWKGVAVISVETGEDRLSRSVII